MKFQRLALIGCGLMGGSFALALRQAGLVQTIAGFSASEKTRQRAVELEVIDQACTSVAEAVTWLRDEPEAKLLAGGQSLVQAQRQSTPG